MIEVEKYDCDDLNEACKRERYWIEKLKSTLNKVIPTRTLKEYKNDNKEKMSEYQKVYSQKNKEKKIEYQKKYYKDNKDDILEYKEINK